MKKNAKKITAIILSLMMIFSLSALSFADNTPPSIPSGENGQTPPSPPSGQGGNGAPGGAAPGGAPGSSSGVDSYDAVVTYDSDYAASGESFTSTGTDENAILVTGGNVELSDVTVSRVSQDSTGGDNSSFYGVGAAVLATGGELSVSGAEITTDAAGGAGVFAYSDGVIYISDSTISTSKDTSGGIHAAGGGTVYAANVTATTEGNSSAAIRSDRGGGLMVVDGGSYTSNGTGSPAVYCTANIAIKDASLTATNSEAVCIEGLNSLYLYDCDLTGDMHDDDQNDCTWTVIVYQSMSGDSELGCGTFQMSGGTLTSKNGGVFYTTNTESRITLSDVEIIKSDDSEFFLMCTGNTNQRGWGSAGKNGGDLVFTAISQEIDGDVIYDSISTLDFYLTSESTVKGAFIDDETYAGSGGDGYANLYIEEGSTWIVTGDSTLTAIYNEGTITDEDGKTVTIKDTDGNILVSGDGKYTVTVASYSEEADFSGMSELAEYGDVQVNSASSSASVPEGSSDGGEAPEKPDGENGEAPEKPDGENGEAPEKPDDENGEAPEKPDGENGEAPEKPDGEGGEAPEKPDGEGFMDVSEDDWYSEYVSYAKENGLMNGTSDITFSPEETTTRAMVVTVLYRLYGSPEIEEDAEGFSDVESGSWYEDASKWAKSVGISTGNGDGTFSPEEAVTREQFAAFLYRYASYIELVTDSAADLSSFADADSVSEYAISAMQYAVESGIISGKEGGVLDPGGSTTRAEAAAMLTRFHKSL